MKLLYCGNCGDVFNLTEDERTCTCGRTRGMYIDSVSAWYAGDLAVPLGFANTSFENALINQPDEDKGKGECFEAFVIPKHCATFGRASQ